MYKGSETKCTVENLEAGADYCVKVCPIRVTSTGELAGPFSQQITFSTVAGDTQPVAKATTSTNCTTQVHRNRNYLRHYWLNIFNTKSMSDQQMIMVGAVLLMFLGIFIAVVLASLVKMD